MSSPPAVLKGSIQRLVDEGYEVEVRNEHLLVHAIPYVNGVRQVDLGILACPCTEEEHANMDHTVSFKGGVPFRADGKQLDHLVNQQGANTLFPDFVADFKFSNKPQPNGNFPETYYEKMVHYIDLLSAPARAIDPNADARTGIVILSREENPVFRYPDSASARAGISAVSAKLKLKRLAIIGLGGTGSYVLDQVAKTPVYGIHLFDGDVFNRHNAFRSPGAASIESLQRRLTKVAYYAELYGQMRSGIVEHPYHIDGNNLAELAGFDFVFVCVDDGPSRGMICAFLAAQGVPFVDVGMGIMKNEDELSLSGGCRVTVATPEKRDHLERRLPVTDGRGDLYKSNIQVADLNAMNAILAVMKWKQLFGFYADNSGAHEIGFSVALNSIELDEIDRTGKQ